MKKLGKSICIAMAALIVLSTSAFAGSTSSTFLAELFENNETIVQQIEHPNLSADGRIYRITAESIIGDAHTLHIVMSLERKDGRTFAVNVEPFLSLFRLEVLKFDPDVAQSYGYSGDLTKLEAYSTPQKQYYHVLFNSIEPGLLETFTIFLSSELEEIGLELPAPTSEDIISLAELNIQTFPGIWIDSVEVSKFGFYISGRNEHYDDNLNFNELREIPEIVMHCDDKSYVLYGADVLSWNSDRENDIVRGRGRSQYPDKSFHIIGNFLSALDLSDVTAISVGSVRIPIVPAE